MWQSDDLSRDVPRPRSVLNHYTTGNHSPFVTTYSADFNHTSLWFGSDEDDQGDRLVARDFSSSSGARSPQIQDSAAAPSRTILEVTSPNNSFEGDIVNFMTQVMDHLNKSVTSKTALLTEAGNLLDRIKRSNDVQEDFVTEITLPDITIDSSGPSASSTILTSASDDEVHNNRPTTSDLSCPICFKSLRGLTVCATMCGHIFCDACIFASLERSKRCPTCRKTVIPGSVHPLYL